MSVHPDVRIVLGVKVVGKQEETRSLKGQKYDEDTGKPYLVYESSYRNPEPEWFGKAYEAQQERDECWVEDGEMGIIQDFNSGESTVLVGKLLMTIHPRDFDEEDIFSLDMQELLSVDRFGVHAFLAELGMPGVKVEDIKLWFDTEWV